MAEVDKVGICKHTAKILELVVDGSEGPLQGYIALSLAKMTFEQSHTKDEMVLLERAIAAFSYWLRTKEGRPHLATIIDLFYQEKENKDNWD